MELIHPKTNEDFGYLECEMSAKSKDLDDYLSNLVKDSLEENISIDAQLNDDLWVEGEICLELRGLDVTNIDLLRELFDHIKSKRHELKEVSFDDYYNSNKRTMEVSANLKVKVNLVVRKLENFFSINPEEGDGELNIEANSRVYFCYFSEEEQAAVLPVRRRIEDSRLQSKLNEAVQDFIRKEEINMVVKHFSN